MKKLITIACCWGGLSAPTIAVEQTLKGVLDFRAVSNNTAQPYTAGGLGKYRFKPGESLALAQGGLSYSLAWDNRISVHIVANAYLDGADDGLGITEAFLGYRGLPSENGLRFQARVGVMYPDISMENIATAWSSPYTLSYSAINSWIGEEVRHAGVRGTLTRLGSFHQSEHDVSINAELFAANDTSGAMLAWHGWTLSSRQSLWGQSLPIASIPALQPGGELAVQAPESKPFIELDNKLGVNANIRWHWRQHGEFKGGYYDNNAEPGIVKQGQYAWRTHFAYLGAKWRLPGQFLLLTQWMSGQSQMTSLELAPVVDIGFQSFYLLLSRRWEQHRLSVRWEDFSVDDLDVTPGDDNHEQGQGMTVSYSYRLNKRWFLHAEYNYLNGNRAARRYLGQTRDFSSNQWQLAARYFF